MTNARITPPEEREGRRTAFQQATSTGDVPAAILALRGKGIANPEQFAHLGAEAILGTVRWFDAQNGRVGVGVLVNELRAGGRPGWRARGSVVDVQREYIEGVCDWLRSNLPDLLDEQGWPHPAAIVAVTHLHQRLGKGSVTRVAHGPVIRAAVDAWNVRWGDERKVA